MTIRTSIQLTTWGRTNKKTGSRKITKMDSFDLWSNGIPQPQFERTENGNHLTLWCKERFQKEHDGERFIFIDVDKNTEIEIVYHVMNGDAE